jgi:transposase InsO family protein
MKRGRKPGRKLTGALCIAIAPDVLMRLVAMSYHMGRKGMLGKTARPILEQAVTDYYNRLSEAQKAEYDEILANVQITESGSDVKLE